MVKVTITRLSLERDLPLLFLGARLEDAKVGEPSTAVELGPDLINLPQRRVGEVASEFGVQDTDADDGLRGLVAFPSHGDGVAGGPL
jgi:hypothetical protein